MVCSRRDVRILLVGEPGVGKTSLILSLVSEEFPECVPARSEDITIPADVTPEDVPTHIVDYSSLEQNEDELYCELRCAHVVCIVYSVDDPNTLDKVTEYWLPQMRSTLGENHTTPVVLVGNKVDLVEYSTLDTVMAIMNEYSEIETCVECSARTLKNITELFYYAQKAILYPSAPLFSVSQSDLTDGCKAALSRVFKICDLNNDGVLCDVELNMFQQRCFHSPLHAHVLSDVKHIVHDSLPDGVTEEGLTFSGFLFLHLLFVQRGRLETTWTVLRRFGYRDDLTIGQSYLSPELTVPSGFTTELSRQGLQFLQALFEKHDMDGDGCLDHQELIDLFSTCPRQPWGKMVCSSVPTDHRGLLTLEGFLCQWYLWAVMSPCLLLQHLAHLGYSYIMDCSQTTALSAVPVGSADILKRQSCRSVFRCHVIGVKGVGKSAFLQCLLGRNINSWLKYSSRHTACSVPPTLCVNSVPVYGQSKYLLLREVSLSPSDPGLAPHPKRQGEEGAGGQQLLLADTVCDVVCLMYDASDPSGFQTVASVYKRYFSGSTVPCLLVANKTDIDVVRQSWRACDNSGARFETPSQFCRRHRLPPPVPFSCSASHLRHDVFVKLATMASYPNMRPGMSMLPSDQGGWLKVGAVITALLCGGIILIRYTGVHPLTHH